MTLTVHGHQVTTQPADGLAGYLRVFADGQFVGLIAYTAAGYRTLPASKPGCGCGPVCWCPTQALALSTLIAETIDHQETP